MGEIKDDPKRPLVIVFGAGVTGLAAAHELIERGFRVHVLEPSESLDHYGCCEVGGMARSQYARLAKTTSPQAVTGPPEQVHTARGTPQLVYFDEDSSTWDDAFTIPEEYIANKWVEPPNWAKLLELIQVLIAVRKQDKSNGIADTFVHVIGHSSDSSSNADARQLGCDRAKAVVDELEQLLKKDPDYKEIGGITLVPMSRGADDPIGDNNHEAGRARNDRVSFELPEVRLPGEHGYRFYPAFYHNLDDQLRRIPVYDRQGLPTHRTVLDNLEHAESARFGVEDGQPPIRFERRLPRSFEELRRTAEELANRLGFPVDDFLFFELKMLKFMTASTARRKAEYENVSWWEFVEGDRYAPVTQRHLRAAPQALVAMEAFATDAYTAGNIYLQLLLDHLSTGARVDRTMNAPTSEAWLRHWKRYLRIQGVKFFVGKLIGLDTKPVKDAKPRLKPIFWRLLAGFESSTPTPEPVYMDEVDKYSGQDIGLDWELTDDCHFVLALPAQVAQTVLQSVPNDADLDETLLKLKHYDLGSQDSTTGKRIGALRDFVGIQFYFPHDLKFTSGHTYYPDSDWGLSSISQLQFWKDRRTRDSRYLGVLSVDIGNMVEPDRSRYRLHVVRARVAMRNAESSAARVDLLTLDAEQRKAMRRALAGGNAARKAAADLTNLLPFKINAELQKALRVARGIARQFSHSLSEVDRDALKAALVAAESAAHGPNSLRVARILASIRTTVDAVYLTGTARKKPPGGKRTEAQLVARAVAKAFLQTIRALRLVRKGKTAWQSTRMGIAAAVWRQIKLGLDPVQAKAVPDPLWFHIDDNLEFHPTSKPDDGDDGTVSRNNSPFQINLVGDFDLRPGKGLALPPEIRDDSGTRQPGPTPEFYEIANHQWLVAGMFTKTYTRLSTMELGVESARHAVNGLLHGLVKDGKGQIPGKIMGDLCRIENPERYEIDDLAFLKRIDEQLFAEGLPHFVDILGLEDAVLTVKRMRERGRFDTDPLDQALRFLRVTMQGGRSELNQLRNSLPVPNLAGPLQDGLIGAVDQIADIVRKILGR